MTAAFTLNGMLLGAWAARVPAFKEGFQLEPASLGFLLLALAAGAIVSFPFAGAMSERLGPDRLTRFCALGYIPALIVLPFAPTPIFLGLFLFVFGALHGSMDVAMNGWGAAVEERMKRSTMTIFHAMFSVGAGVGAGTGYLAATSQLSPSIHFAAVATAGGVLAIWLMARPRLQPKRTVDSSEPLIALPSRSLLPVGLIAFAVSMGEGAMTDWSAVFLRIVADATEAQAALGYTAFSIGMVMTRLCGGVLVERFGPVIVTQSGAAIAVVGLSLAIGLGGVGPTLSGFLLMGVGYAVVMPLAFSLAAKDPELAPGPAIASVATLGYGGLLLGPPIIGFIAQLTGMRLSFLVLVALTFLAFALAPRLRR